MISYIALHAIFGAVAGIGVFYLKNAQRLARTKAWLSCLAAMGICLGIAALIGELSQQRQVEELYKWLGAGAVLLTFIGTFSLAATLEKSKKRIPKGRV
jgi:hypothetical protein